MDWLVEGKSDQSDCRRAIGKVKPQQAVTQVPTMSESQTIRAESYDG